MPRVIVDFGNDTFMSEFSGLTIDTAHSICQLLNNMNETTNASVCKGYEQSLKEIGRKEAIDEFVSKLKTTNSTLTPDQTEWIHSYFDFELDEIAEQMKGAKK